MIHKRKSRRGEILQVLYRLSYPVYSIETIRAMKTNNNWNVIWRIDRPDVFTLGSVTPQLAHKRLTDARNTMKFSQPLDLIDRERAFKSRTASFSLLPF